MCAVCGLALKWEMEKREELEEREQEGMQRQETKLVCGE